MSRRFLAILGLTGFVVALLVSLSSGRAEPAASPPLPLGNLGGVPAFRPQASLAPVRSAGARRGLLAYRGAAAWVDQYDRDVLDDPYPALSEMKDRGVRTVFLETGSWRLPRSLDFRDVQGASLIIDQAHGLGMKVVGWYLPGLDDVALDMRRTRAAMRLRTERGGRFDGWAVDIESQRVHPVAARNSALMRYSRAVRRLVGSDFALGAIVPDERS